MKFKPIWIVRIVVCIIIAFLFIMQQSELSETYQKGIAAEKRGDYKIALQYMRSIAEYKDAPAKAEEYQLELEYQSGCELIELENWDDALKKFEGILNTKEYKDTLDKKYLCLYEQARKLSLEGEIHQAELIYMRLPVDFMDVKDRKKVITDHKKFGGAWKCEENNLDLKTSVYVDYNNVPRIRARISDQDGLLLDEPITLDGEGMEVRGDRFSWAIYGTDSYSFVYGKDQYTVMKQPVVAGTQKYVFKRIIAVDYDVLNKSYMTTEF